ASRAAPPGLTGPPPGEAQPSSRAAASPINGDPTGRRRPIACGGDGRALQDAGDIDASTPGTSTPGRRRPIASRARPTRCSSSPKSAWRAEGAGRPEPSFVQISALDALAKSVGSNRIVRGKAITSIVGDPDLSPAEERRFRKRLVMKALEALQTTVEEPTVFA